MCVRGWKKGCVSQPCCPPSQSAPSQSAPSHPHTVQRKQIPLVADKQSISTTPAATQGAVPYSHLSLSSSPPLQLRPHPFWLPKAHSLPPSLSSTVNLLWPRQEETTMSSPQTVHTDPAIFTLAPSFLAERQTGGYRYSRCSDKSPERCTYTCTHAQQHTKTTCPPCTF